MVNLPTSIRNPRAPLHYIRWFVSTCFDTWTKVYPNFHIRVGESSPALANVSHLSWTLEGGMQPLGHHSTSFSSRKFPSSKRPVASTSSPTYTQRRRGRYVRVRGRAESEVKQTGHGGVCWKTFEIPSLPSAPGQFLTSSSTAWYCHFLKGEVLQLFSTAVVPCSLITILCCNKCRWQSPPLVREEWCEFIH